MCLKLLIRSFAVLMVFHEALAQTVITVNTTGANPDTNATGGGLYGTTIDLRGAVNYINQNPGNYTINLPAATITLSAALPIINMNSANVLTFAGISPATTILDGASAYRGLFIRQGAVTVQNMTIQHTLAQGGAGGACGGGGGMGAGGALFVDQASVTLSNVTFGTTAANGGTGGANGVLPGGGGGGLGGAGGSSAGNPGFHAAGGGGGLGGNGGNGIDGLGGSSGGGGGAGWLATGGSPGIHSGSGGGGGAGVGQIGGAGGGNNGVGTNIGGSNTTSLSIGGGGGGGGGESVSDDNGGYGGNTAANVGAAGGLGAISASGPIGGGGGGGGHQGSQGSNADAATRVGGRGGPGDGTSPGQGGGGGGSGSGFSSYGGNGGNGGGGGGGDTLGGAGGYGGGGGGGGTSGGNIGGFGGGGGGGSLSRGGAGGFGGGGGGGGSNSGSNIGGFGGGGGGCNPSTSPGRGGVGGGSGAQATGSDGSGGGGGGAGFGGAIFVNSGGSLIIQGAVSTASGDSTVVAGNGGGSYGSHAGASAGSDLFALTGSTLSFSPPITTTATIFNSIGDDSSNTLPGPNYTPGTGSGVSIAVNGAGTVVLSGTNTHSGGTTMSAGTLNINADAALGAASTSLSVTGSATLQAAQTFALSARPVSIGAGNTLTVDTQGNTLTIPGVISGTTGSLTKIGTGELVLTNATNSYSGDTTISSGKLSLSGSGTIASTGSVSLTSATSVFNINSLTTTGITIGDLSSSYSASSVTLGAKTLTLGTNNSTLFAGVISDANLGGVLIKQGTGTLTLSATNTYTGGTTILNGAIQANALGSLGSGNVTNDSELIFNPSASGTYSPIISGSGSVTKIGGETLTLDHVHSYTGGTTINGGTLALSGNGSLASDGGLSLTDSSSIFDVSGANGTRTIGDLSGTSGSQVLLGNNLLKVLENSTSTFAGNISDTGSGSLEKQGSGLLNLSGTNTINTTTVATGQLAVNGSLTSASASYGVIVNFGTILQGTGTIHANVGSNGVISPGNSIGTLTINGNLETTESSTTAIEISPSQSSRIDVSGHFSPVSGNSHLGTLQINADPGQYPVGTNFIVLNAAGGIVSTFGALDSPSLFFTALYYPTYIQIYILPNSLPACRGNSASLVNYFNSLTPGSLGDVMIALKELAVSPPSLCEACQGITPARNAIGSFVGEQAAFSFSDILSSHLDNYRILRPVKNGASSFSTLTAVNEHEEELLAQNETTAWFWKKKPAPKKSPPLAVPAPYNVWLGGVIDRASQDARSQNPAFSYMTEAVVGAFDVAITDNYLIGVGLGYANSSIHQHEDFGKGRLDMASSVVYGSAFWRSFYLELAMWNSYQRIGNVRHIYFSGFDQQAKSHHHCYQGTPHVGFGYDFKMLSATRTKVILEPFAMLDWAYLREKGFMETGAGLLNMQEGSRFSSILRTEAGLNQYVSHTYENHTIFICRLKLSYINEVPYNVGLMTANLVGFPGSFTVNSFTNVQNLISPRVEFFWKEKRGGHLSLAYEGKFGKHGSSNEFFAKVGRYF